METTLIDIKKKIMADIQSDPSINARAINARAIRLEHAGRGAPGKRTLRVSGVVSDGAQKERVLKIVQHRAGDTYTILDNLYVSDLLWEG